MSDSDEAQARLAKRLDALESKETDRRVAEGISKWERRRGALIVLVLGVLGIASFSDINRRITDYFTKSVVGQIDAEVKTRTAGISVQDPDIAELKTRTAELQQALEQLGAAATAPVAPTAASGFAFFGIRSTDGSWAERYFDIAGGGDREPKTGDQVSATGSVNVRSGYIVYGPGGWTNQRATGVLRPGDDATVVEAKEVVSGFWWISFAR